ncbi:MAG TPA: serine hydrolase [Candidatus Angelobacter sp.]|jgi:CubicO group peptidase (beta-lactamase class C family)|nr:serine hydrolase [Candidatus Angelobacter sp.]
MRSRPSKTAETIVAVFVPPTCREEVLGDLHERYRSPGQYALDAMRTVPLVIYSRTIRAKFTRARREIMSSKTAAIVVAMLIWIGCIVWIVNAGRPSLPALPYSEFLVKVQTGQVSSVVLKHNNSNTVLATCRMKDSTTVRTVLPPDYTSAMSAMLENKVRVEMWDPSSGYLRLFIQFTPLFLCAGFWTFLMIRHGPNGPFFRSLRLLRVVAWGVGLLPLLALDMTSSAQSKPAPAVLSDDEIRKILIERIDVQHQSVGIVVGVITPEGRRIVSYGHFAQSDPRPLNGDTIFEIGSATKVFTSLLLADMVQHGQVALDDPVSKYLPKTVKVPERNGRSITLVDLATHTSGLPRLPGNMTPKDPGNPYADYTVDQLYQFLSSYQLTRDIGSKYGYSNLGGGLLGHVLALRAGTDYEALVVSRICDPLRMKSTRITLSPETKARLAVGHNAGMAPVENWDVPTLAGAGALRSTANDLLNFLAANLGYTNSPLAPPMAAMLKTRRPTGQADLEVALGWHIFTINGKEIVWHNGGTGGYRSFMGYDPAAKIGVVALSNAETNIGVDDIGRHLLDASVPLAKPPAVHKEVKVDPKLFDGYAGTYQLTPAIALVITREGDHLFLQVTGQPKFEIFPEGDRDYFLKVVDAQISFVTDGQGRATELILHQGGLDQHAKRAVTQN